MCHLGLQHISDALGALCGWGSTGIMEGAVRDFVCGRDAPFHVVFFYVE